MPSPSTSSPTSFKLWFPVGAALLAILALLWFALGRDGGDDDAGADASANTERPRGPAPTPDTSNTPASASMSASAAGQIRATNGDAIAHALVTLAPLDEDVGAPTTTLSADDGSWSLAELPAGRYALSATAAGFLPGLRPELTLRPGVDEVGLDLRLEPGGNLLSGTISDKTGGVIEGALVQVTPQSGIAHMRERDSFFTLSDEQGRYALQVSDGRHRVRASHPDYSSESLVLELAKQPLTHDFALVPSAVIEGVVLRESDGAPVPGAELSWGKSRMITLPDGANASTRERGGRLLADANGRFRISGLPPGIIELRGRAPALASESALQIPVAIAERVEGVELMLAAAHDLSGRVVAATDGAGIEGARVELRSKLQPELGARTDANGQFTIHGVLSGSYRAFASAEGWSSPAGPPVSVEVGAQASSLVLELERSRSIRGRVEPAAHAEVSIELRPEHMRIDGGAMLILATAGSSPTAEDTGAFELGPVEPGRYTLEAHTADGRGGSVEVEVGDDGAQGVVIPLTPRASLSGHVEDKNGKLVTDVSVRARKQGNELSIVFNGRELMASSSPSSSEGRFELVGLAAGVWWIEVVDKRGDVLPMHTGEVLELELGEAEAKQIVLRVEPRDGTISGTVRDAEGHPVADAWVSAAFMPPPSPPPGEDKNEDGQPHTQMRMIIASDDATSVASSPPVLSDEHGRFVFTQLRRGDYTLSAELDGGLSTATLERVRPDADVHLDLAPLGALEGKVLSNGQPANGMVHVVGPSVRAVRVREGSFEIERLEPGRYTVEASAGDGASNTVVEIEAGETATVELALERFAKITGTIVDEDGTPIANAEVLIGNGSGGRVEIKKADGDPQILTNSDGSFETRAAAGARVLLVQAPGMPMPIVIKPFVVEAGIDVDLGELRKQARDNEPHSEPSE